MVEHVLGSTETSRPDGNFHLEGTCSCGWHFSTTSKVSAAYARAQLKKLQLTHARRELALQEEAHE